MSSTQPPNSPQTTRFTLAVDRFVYGLSRHWLAVFNIVIAIYAGLPLLAPVLMEAGATRPAQAIYTVYSPLCHQMASRSFFLFGDQAVYPRAIAGTDFTPIEAYMPAIPEFEDASPDPAQWTSFILPARQFVGNEEMGYKTALCQRDMAIYGFVLLGGLLYGLLRRNRNIKPLPLWAFLVFGLGPIALDGFSQLFSQYLAVLAPALEALPLRESTPLLRTATGAMFGFSLVWLTYPHIGASMARTEAQQREKLARAEALP